MAGYSHPHSFVRLPNGHVLATSQHQHHVEHEAHLPTTDMGRVGGLVEIDDRGEVIRTASAADPAFPNALLTPYSLLVLPDIDRVISTNSSMHLANIFSGATYQVWRLSDAQVAEDRLLRRGRQPLRAREPGGTAACFRRISYLCRRLAVVLSGSPA